MNSYTPKVLMLVISVILATILLSSRSQLGQVSTQLPAKANLRKFLSKHSALPPIAQFAQAQAEAPQDHERRQSRQRVSRGLYSGKVIFDPGTREVNGESETLDLKFIDGVKI